MTARRTPGEVVLELMALGLALKRQNLRRAHPGEDESQIERRLREWIARPAGAPDGDAPGRVRAWPDPP